MNNPPDPRCCDYCDRPIVRDSRGRCRNCAAAVAPAPIQIRPGAVFEFERVHGRAPMFIPAGPMGRRWASGELWPDNNMPPRA